MQSEIHSLKEIITQKDIELARKDADIAHLKRLIKLYEDHDDRVRKLILDKDQLSKALETPVDKLARHGELAEDEANKANN